jgi:hypothetical protein
MGEFKPWGPGHATGGETTTVADSETGSPGPGKSYYPDREAGGYVTGGEPTKDSSPGSSVPARPNPQAGNLAQVKSEMRDAVDKCAEYGGHGDMNPTGSSYSNPAGARTDPDAGFYGSRPESSPGTNAGGSSGEADRPSRGYSSPSDKNA